MKGMENFDKEKAHFNLARLKKAGDEFEVIIDPDKAIAFRNKTISDVRDALKYEKIFADAKKGMTASEQSMSRAFNTADAIKVAEIILREGEIQLTAAYRDELREAKRRQIVQLIHRNAIDPRTKLPHPEQRIINALEEAKVRIDEHKKAEDQLDEVLKKLQPILPIRFETRKIQVLVPTKFASKANQIIRSFGKVSKETWHSDGTLFAIVELPAGLQQEMTDSINKLTHGDVDIKILEE